MSRSRLNGQVVVVHRDGVQESAPASASLEIREVSDKAISMMPLFYLLDEPIIRSEEFGAVSRISAD
jgi:hypothetical protein